MPAAASRRLQPELFACASPLVDRLGLEFFRSLPRQPGVYYFHAADGTLLYIGQSNCLRNRLGSYRFVHPGRHPRRTMRLIARVHRITWELCVSASEAMRLEAQLLLKHRPPFNRAGVWKGPHVYLRAECVGGRITLELIPGESEAAGEAGLLGPMPPGFRYAFGALVRVLHARTTGSYAWWDFPHGMLRGTVAPRQSWTVPPDNPVGVTEFGAAVQFLQEGGTAWLDRAAAEAAPVALGLPAHQFWQEQWESLQQFARKRQVFEPTPPTPP